MLISSPLFNWRGRLAAAWGLREAPTREQPWACRQRLYPQGTSAKRSPGRLDREAAGHGVPHSRQQGAQRCSLLAAGPGPTARTRCHGRAREQAFLCDREMPALAGASKGLWRRAHGAAWSPTEPSSPWAEGEWGAPGNGIYSNDWV